MRRPTRLSAIATVCLLGLLLTGGFAARAAAQEHAAPAGHEAVAPAGHEAAPATGHEAPAGETVAGDHAAAAEGHGEGHGGEGEHEAPNLVTLIAGLIQGGAPEPTPAVSFMHRFQAPLFAGLVALILITVLTRVASRRVENPGRMQVAVEMLFDGLYNLFGSVIGPSARRYTPYLGTLFLFILCNNLMGMVPFGFAATSKLNTTVALAICTFLLVQYIGITENGIGGYLFHMAGSPRSGMEWGFSVLLFPLHILGEFIKPMSLSLRLYGNIFGEETLVATFVILGAGMLAKLHVPFGIPIQVPLMFLGLLTSVIQALVFTLLSTVYIALMLPHHEHGEEHGNEAHAH